MGMHFKKSVKIAPGVKLNVGKKSAGISVGGKYGGVSINSKTGARARVSAPGTGVSYSTKLNTAQKENQLLEFSETEYSPKSKGIALVLCLFWGILGIHKFYVNRIGEGFLYLFTGGLFCIGWIVDIIKILSGKFKDKENRVLR
jgi:hypothetical protein